MSLTRRDTMVALAGSAVLAGAANAATPEQHTLLQAALEVRQKAYAPYSHFLVGAALQTEDGTVFKGCNVENISYGATICAERNAVFQAVAAGHKKFKAIAVNADLPTPIDRKSVV